MAYRPRIVAFLCEHCASAAADAAGRARLAYPQALLAIRVVCTGRVEPAHVLQAFREGADGVLLAGCHPGDCHHVRGNLTAAARHELLVASVAALGIEPERLALAWVGASEAQRFADVVSELAARLERLGPLDYARRALDEVPDALSVAMHRVERIDAGALSGEALHAPPRARPRVAFYWNASCGGCEEAVIDLAEGLQALLERVEVVLWPVALDVRRKDVEALPDGAIDVAFVNGAVRLSEQEEWAHLLRRKARTLVAFGACAHTGGVVGLGNLCTAEEIVAAARRGETDAVPRPPGPERELELPALLSRVLPLDHVVDVDCTIPGCPPSTEVIAPAIERLLTGDLPPKGAVLSPGKALCETCSRRDSRPERLELAVARRLSTSQPDPSRCFLADGFVCAGPATRQGCGEGCIAANVPCRGCSGAVDGVRDQGAALLAAMGSLVPGESEDAVRGAARTVVDPVGTFWRYGLARALVPARPRKGSA
jgi:F420-non-reducing hydrogenase small subunit